jgi:hypothetical protein
MPAAAVCTKLIRNSMWRGRGLSNISCGAACPWVGETLLWLAWRGYAKKSFNSSALGPEVEELSEKVV